MDDLEDGKFDGLTQNQLMATVGKMLSKEDWKETVQPAHRDRRAEVKTISAMTEAVIKAEIKDFNEKQKLDKDLDVQDRIRRRYNLFIKQNPTASAEERLEYYKKLGSMEKLESRWWAKEARGIEIIERKERGQEFNPITRDWDY